MNYNNIFARVFKWMAIGLLVSFVTAFFVSNNPNMIYNIFGTNTFWFVIIMEFVLVIVLSAFIHKLSSMWALICFILYCFTSGLTLSIVCYSYTIESIFYTFLVTSGMFGVLSYLGYKTNKDLTKFGNILFIGLIAAIIMSLINLFIGNGTLEIIISVAIILIFCGLIAYDVQKIKRLSMMGYDEDKLGIIGALELYLDFINIFLELIKYIGKEK